MISPPAPAYAHNAAPHQPRLLDRIRDKIRFNHYSIRTEQAYVDWVRRFVLFHGKRHPVEMAAAGRADRWRSGSVTSRRYCPQDQRLLLNSHAAEGAALFRPTRL